MSPQTIKDNSVDVLQNLFCSVVGSYIEQVDQMKLEVHQLKNNVHLMFSVEASDMGYVVGIDGVNIRALQFIFNTLGVNLGLNVSVRLIDPTRTVPAQKKRWVKNNDWPKEKVLAVFKKLLGYLYPSFRLDHMDLKDGTTTIVIEFHPENLKKELEEHLTRLMSSALRKNGRIPQITFC